jgi:hypothetical protein
MTASALNPNRIVPVQEDLTTPDTQLEIIRGWEKMHRVDKVYATGVNFVKGEWAVLGDNDKLTRPTATPVVNTYLVIAGNDRFDAVANGQCTIVMASKIVARTTKYAAGTYHVGSPLNVKDLGAGEAVVSLATGTQPVLARVTKLGSNFLEFETL